MKMVEQNISGVKLERLRQNAVKKHKILRKLFPVCLILFIGLTLVKNRFLFASISEYGWGDPATQGAFWMLVGNLMLSVIFAGVIFGFYYMLVYKKAYDLFCINFKNKYVLDTLRQLPDFSELRYNAGGGLSYEEMNRLKLIPGGQSVFYQSSDELSGKLDGVPFRAVNVCTGEKASARSSTPKILFEGQVIVFSCFDNRKISEGFSSLILSKDTTTSPGSGWAGPSCWGVGAAACSGAGAWGSSAVTGAGAWGPSAVTGAEVWGPSAVTGAGASGSFSSPGPVFNFSSAIHYPPFRESCTILRVKFL